MGQSLGPIDLRWAFKIRAKNKEGLTFYPITKIFYLENSPMG